MVKFWNFVKHLLLYDENKIDSPYEEIVLHTPQITCSLLPPQPSFLASPSDKYMCPLSVANRAPKRIDQLYG